MKNIVGYSDNWVVSPNDDIGFMVSGIDVSHYDAQLVRVICGDDRPSGPGFQVEEIEAPLNGRHEAIEQKSELGSYLKVAKTLMLDTSSGLIFTSYIMPTAKEVGRQTILDIEDKSGFRFEVFIDSNGFLSLTFQTADISETITLDAELVNGKWYSIRAAYSGQHQRISLSQQALLQQVGVGDTASHEAQTLAKPTVVNNATMLVAASHGKQFVNHCFNGKVDRPRLLKGESSDWCDADLNAISPAESKSNEVIAWWDFSDDINSFAVSDNGREGYHGELINMPSRACKGFNWDGSYFDWNVAPEQYAAVHFHDDDLMDSGWDVSLTYTIPETLKSGVYALRLRADTDESYITFIVRALHPGQSSKLAFLASTATYNAYGNSHWALHHPLAEARRGHVLDFSREEAYLQEERQLGLSSYDTHTDGSGVRFVSRLRPIMNHGPKTRVWNLNADTHLLCWLEKQGLEYEVITDDDLHKEGAELLKHYRCVMTGSHPEYISSSMWQGIADFQDSGGRLMYMGGNGFYWRIAYHKDNDSLIEVRRSEDGARYWAEEPGEHYLSFNGEYGGLWRRVGSPPNELVGLSTRATGFDACSYYRCTDSANNPRASFIFNNVNKQEKIGDFGYVLGGAAGLEIDAADFTLGTPPHALIVASSEEHSEQMLLAPEETDFHHPLMAGVDNPEVKADMIFYETNNGGAVFSTGSIAWVTSLLVNNADNNVSQITRNVIDRFMDKEPIVPHIDN